MTLRPPVVRLAEPASAPPSRGQSHGSKPYALRSTIAAMTPGAAPKIQIPRWMQLVGLPLLLILAWVVAGRVFHVVFLFLVATLIALLLDPLVKAIGAIQIGRFRIRRGLAVTIVYLGCAAALIVAIWGLATVVVDQTKTAANRFDTYFTTVDGRTGQTDADRDVDRLQHWLNTHGLKSIDIQERGHRWVKQVRDKDVGKYTNKIVDFVEGAAISIGKLLFAAIVVIVVSIYMLLDFAKLARAIDRRFPPHAGSEPLLVRIEHAVAGYVKGQFLVSLIIGASAGLGMWVFGVTGLVPGRGQVRAPLRRLGGGDRADPVPRPLARRDPGRRSTRVVVDPISIIWVTILFLVIHQVEGHIVVPKVMGSALRLHPLLVIFGLLAGGEIYGLAGILVALPLLAAGRAVYEFFSRARRARAVGGAAARCRSRSRSSQPPPPVVPDPGSRSRRSQRGS